MWELVVVLCRSIVVMLLVWCWMRGPRFRLWPGIEGRVNRWWRWVALEPDRRQAASEARPDPRKMEAETTASHWQVRELGIEDEVLGKANAFFTPGHHNTSALN